MKEVSCKLLGIFFREAERRAIPFDALMEGIPYGVKHLRDKHERIEWTVFVQFMDNCSRIWSEEELIQLGAAFIESPFFRMFAVVGRLLFTPLDFYRWLNKERSGTGNQLFTCMTPRHREVGPNQIILELHLKAGYKHSRACWLCNQGGMSAIPRLVGLKSASVTLEVHEWGARFHITYPNEQPVLTRFWRSVTWLFTARSAAQELKEANEVLLARYEQLESAQATLSLQAAQLETAGRIGAIVQGNLDLDRTLTAVTRALVETGGFAHAHVAVDAGFGGALVRREAREGEAHLELYPVQLSSGMRALGTLTLAPLPTPAQSQLLSSVLPTITMALDNAVTHAALQESRQNLERRVEERTAALTQASERLEQTLGEVTEAKQARDRIFANINHEIRTPLSIIKSAAAELRQPSSSDWVERRAESIDFATNRLLRLVNDLLDLAAGREGKLQLHRIHFDLVRHLRLVVDSWSHVAQRDNITLSLVAPESKPAYLDQDKIDRSISNLISNAIKYTPAGGTVAVRLDCDDGKLRISVQDSGTGLDQKLLSRIFGRFETGKAPLRGGAGSGIGLSLVKELIELHGGSVEAGNAPEGGARFMMTLPDHEASGPTVRDPTLVAAPSYRTLEPQSYNIASRGESASTVLPPEQVAEATVLVAEDDDVLRESLGRLLRVRYRVLLASDGEVALQLARKYLPDLLLSDVDMPNMDGIELVRRFQAIPELQMPSTILLTAISGLPDRLIGLEAGAVDYVPKPFEPDEVLARVGSQLALRRRALDAARKENLSALGTMVKGLMHELRNPANGLVHSVRLLRELLPPEVVVKEGAADELLGVAELCASQIESMCVDLIGTTGRGDPLRKLVPFAQIASRAQALVSGFLADTELRCDLGYDGAVFCSEPLIAQVLANLIKNGVQAAGRSGWVRMASRVRDGRLVVEVTDSGPGVPEQLRQRIFEMFFTTKQSGEGSGLGLPMSRQIVERHGGVLEVREGPEGTLFHMSLPLGADAHAALQ